jgi:hypothetical protein
MKNDRRADRYMLKNINTSQQRLLSVKVKMSYAILKLTLLFAVAAIAYCENAKGKTCVCLSFRSKKQRVLF